jgi:hypothetical protein
LRATHLLLSAIVACGPAAGLAGASPPGSPVAVRPSDRMLLVGGKPFFAIGTFEAPGTDSALARTARAGFNLCQLPAGPVTDMPSVLDRVQSSGMLAWFGLGELLDFSSDADGKRRQLTELVGNAGTHPALLMWQSVDEPVWTGRNPDGYLEGYRFVRALDPRRPVWTTHAPRNTVAELVQWNRATDIGGADIYPVPEPQRQSDLPNRTISVVGDECDKNIRAVGGRKPVFMVLQGFGWSELTRAPGRPVSARMPTRKQTRFMAYDAVVHGANGILYWGTNRTRKPSPFWSDLQAVVRELGDLQDVLASESLQGPGVARFAVPARGVRLVHKRTGSRHVVIVVNENPRTVTAVVAVPGLASLRVRRLFENTVLPVARGEIRVTLSGYDVAVLSDDGRLAGRRADFSAEWRRPAPPVDATLLSERGNLVGNPGFEVDQDADGVPDEWDASVPLAVSRDAAAHGGRRALALTGMGGVMTPLVVQRGTPILGGRTYRFSGWFKAPPGLEGRIYAEWVLDGVFHSHALPWTRGTGAWRPLSFTFRAEPDPAGSAYVVARVQGTGTALFDDLRLEEVK